MDIFDTFGIMVNLDGEFEFLVEKKMLTFFDPL